MTLTFDYLEGSAAQKAEQHGTSTAPIDSAFEHSATLGRPTPAQPRSFPISFLAPRLIFLGLLVFPLLFGGVHEVTYYLAYILIFATLSAAFLFSAPEIALCVREGPLTRSMLGVFGALAAYLALQFLVLSLSGVEHPVLGTISRLVAQENFTGSLIAICAFCGFYLLARTWLAFSETHINRLLNYLVISAGMIGMVALLHWFYDNGKLFWIFEPQYSAVSSRARWPFVNPNHLAHYLIPAAFLILGVLKTEINNLHSLLLNVHSRNKQTLSLLLGSKSVQGKMAKILLFFTVLLICGVCIAGSLSRSSWIGCALGLFAFLLLSRFAASPGIKPVEAQESRPKLSLFSHSRRRRRGVGRRPLSESDISRAFYALERSFGPLLVALSLFLVVIFLQERGRELIEARIEYGLLHSVEDMRWQLYVDTWPMIREYLLFGVGLGAWAVYFPQYASQGLSGVDPVYLHSEALQTLAELGLVGCAALLFTGALVVRGTWRAIKAADEKYKPLLIGIAGGLIAFCAPMCFDFPLRIPAVAFMLAVMLALLSALGDRAKGQGAAQERLEFNRDRI